MSAKGSLRQHDYAQVITQMHELQTVNMLNCDLLDSLGPRVLITDWHLQTAKRLHMSDSCTFCACYNVPKEQGLSAIASNDFVDFTFLDQTAPKPCTQSKNQAATRCNGLSVGGRKTEYYLRVYVRVYYNCTTSASKAV